MQIMRRFLSFFLLVVGAVSVMCQTVEHLPNATTKNAFEDKSYTIGQSLKLIHNGTIGFNVNFTDATDGYFFATINPRFIAVNVTNITDGQFDVSWTVFNETSVNINAEPGNHSTTGISSPYSLQSLNPNTNYDVVLSATNANGEKSYFFSVLTLPDVPVITNITCDADDVTLTWSGSAETFHVEASLDEKDWSNAIQLTSNTNSATFEDLTDDTTYYFRVIGENATGLASEWSEEFSFSTIPQIGNLTFHNLYRGTVFLSWQSQISGLNFELSVNGSTYSPIDATFENGAYSVELNNILEGLTTFDISTIHDCGVVNSNITGNVQFRPEINPQPFGFISGNETVTINFPNRFLASNSSLDYISVTGSKSGRISGSWIIIGTILEFTPNSNYESGEQIRVVIPNGLSDINNEILIKDGWQWHYEVSVGSSYVSPAEFCKHPIPASFTENLSNLFDWEFFDVDEDGLPDLLDLVQEVWYKNLGDFEFDITPTTATFPINFKYQIDIDNDGLVDLVYADQNQITWRKKLGINSYSLPEVITSGFSVAQLDYQNDGINDLIVLENGGVGTKLVSTPDNGLTWFTENIHSDYFPALYDLDNDGDLDLYGNERIENLGNGNFSTSQYWKPEYASSLTHYSLTWVYDYDKDADLDILYRGPLGSTSNGINLARNTGDGLNYTFSNIYYNDFVGTITYHVTDFTGDHDLDIINSTSGSSAQFLSNENGVFTDGQISSYPGTGGTSGFQTPFIHKKWLDLNGDGYLDIVTSRADPYNYPRVHIFIWENTSVAAEIGDISLSISSNTYEASNIIKTNTSNQAFHGHNIYGKATIDIPSTVILSSGIINFELAKGAGLFNDGAQLVSEVSTVDISAGYIILEVIAADGITSTTWGVEINQTSSSRSYGSQSVLATQNRIDEVYPNPADASFTLQDESLDKASIVIFNTEGKEICRMENLQGTSVEVPTASIPSGLVVVKLIKPNETKEFKLLIQH